VKYEFSHQVFEKQIPYLTKIRQAGAEMFHADGHAYKKTDNTTKVIVVFRNCAKGPKISGAVGRKITKLHDVTNLKPTATTDHRFKYFAFYLMKTSEA
jgi:hypothetical protein